LAEATEIARPDIARPSKLWGLTSREWTKWHQTVRVEIARQRDVTLNNGTNNRKISQFNIE